MKNKTKFISTVAVVVLIVLLGSMLFACNKKKPFVDNTRIDAKDKFVLTILAAQKQDWSSAFNDEELSTRSDSGEYIIASEWMGFVGNLLFDSGLPTAKIEKLVGALNSEEGKKLLAGQTVEIAKVFDLFKSIGFTSVDISELLYDGIVKMLKGSNNVFDNCLNRLERLRNNFRPSIAVSESLNNAIVSIEESKKSFAVFETSENEILSALFAAKTGINALVNFVYKVSISSLTTDMISAISSGALEDITSSEMLTFVGSMVNSVDELKAVLVGGQQVALNSALSLVLNRFESVVLSSNIFAEVLRYVRYAYRALDYLPIACDIIKSASAAIDKSYIEILQQIAKDDTLPLENRAILVAKVIQSALKNHNEKSLVDLINSLAAGTGANNQKTIILFYLDMGINILSMKDDGKPRFLEEKQLGAITRATVCDINLSKFRTLFSAYQSGNKSVTTALRSTASALISYANINLVGEEYFSLSWYNKIVATASSKLNAEILENKDIVVGDLSEFVGYFFEHASKLIDELAGMSIVVNENDEKFARLQEIFEELKFGILFSIK